MFIRPHNRTHCQRLSSTAGHSSLQERQQNWNKILEGKFYLSKNFLQCERMPFFLACTWLKGSKTKHLLLCWCLSCFCGLFVLFCVFFFFNLNWAVHDTHRILIQIYLKGRKPGLFYTAASVHTKWAQELLMPLYTCTNTLRAWLDMFIAFSHIGLSFCKNIPAIPSSMLILWHT